MTVTPRDSKVYGANKVGLKRRDFSSDSIDALQKAFRLLSSDELNTSQAVDRIRAEVPALPEVDELIEFIASASRGIIK